MGKWARHSLLGCGLYLVGSMFSRPVAAQPAPGASEDIAIVPPQALSSPPPEYPEGGRGPHRVVLTLTVGVDGSVSAVRASEGEEPFVAAAIRAASSWRFEPARRGAAPIAAVIRIEVTFTPPAPTSTPEPSTPEAPQENAGPQAAQPQEVTIRGTKTPVPATATLTRAEVRQLPGAFADPFRALDILPGVTPILSGLPYFYVRGSPPANVGYFLDGVRVPYLYHFALGPSVINPALVERVDLYAGAYPAAYGRYAGGIVAAETTAPRSELFGEAAIRVVDAGGVVEAPFAQGRGNVAAGGRYSYTAGLLSLLAPEAATDYRDYQLRVGYDLSPNDRISLFGFGAYDLLGTNYNDQLDVLFATEFHRLDLRYDRHLGPASDLRVAATLGLDRTRVERTFAQAGSVGGRVELRSELTDRLVLQAGADVLADIYIADSPNPYALKQDEYEFRERLFAARTDIATGLHAEVTGRLTRAVQLTSGLRLDAFRSGSASALAVDPRFGAKVQVSDATRIVLASGVAHQPPAFLFPIPAVSIRELRGGLQKALQLSGGVETNLPYATTLTAGLFHNTFLNMNDAASRALLDDANSSAVEKRSRGYAFGLELALKRRLTQRLGGMVSYTLSRSVRTVDGVTQAAAFDRTHVINVALMLDLGRKWRLGNRLLFYTGAPQDQKISEPPDYVARYVRISERLPAYYRLDARIEKRWDIGRGWISFVVEGLNVTLSEETLGYSCHEGQCRPQKVGPVVVPMIGVEGGL